MKSLKTFSTLLVAAALSGCVDDSTDDTPIALTETFDYSAMLANIADNVMIPNYQQLATSADDFAASTSALDNYCTAIGTGNEATARTAAQDSWRDLSATVQTTEIHALGPVLEEDNNNRVLRYRLNNFASDSNFSSCGVDQSVVLKQTDSNFDINTRATNQRGIGAVEYLLFNDDLDHTCPSQIIETQTWNARPDKERKAWRCEYAQALATDIAAAAQSTLTAWQATGGNYRSQFINPSNVEDNLKALSDALFAIEIEVKDRKVGVPLGLQNDCGAIACPERVESPYAENTNASVYQNVLAFKQVFTGGNGLSFDDIIIGEGFPEVAKNFNNMADDASDFADSLSNSLKDDAEGIVLAGDDTDCNNSAANPDTIQTVPACSLHGYLKRITDAMRTDFVTIVELDLPSRAQTDND